jgi:hypothetical protein
MTAARFLSLLFGLPALCAGMGLLARDFTGGASLKERPVQKIVRLLQDMATQLEKEKADDEAVYESLDCWCKENDAAKSKAIELGEAKMEQLKSDMGEYAAKIEELRAALDQTRTKLKADQQALDTATAIRTQEAATFHGEEKELLDAVQACKEALVVLGTHHPSLEQLRTVSKQLEALKMMQLAKDSLGRDKIAVLRAFMQEAEDASKNARLRRIPGFESYTPQSGQIFGILKQMQEEFESDLSIAQKNEMKARADYAGLKEAKEAELAAGMKQLEQLNQDDAAFREKNERAWEEYNDTREQVETDKEFLFNLRKKCEESDKEYASRTQSRAEEIAAVQETISILNTDTGFDVFDKTVNTPTAFLQTGISDPRRKAASALLRRTGSPRLALIAASAQIDGFEKVKAAIDKMVADLTKQQQEEVEHNDWCKTELAANERSTAKEADKKTSLETSIEDMKKTIDELAKGIEENKEAMKNMEAEMKKASEIRESEAADFQETVADQRVTQAILTKAIERMGMVYAMLQQSQQPGAPHIQTSGTHTDPGNGPARFTDYDQNTGGKRVIALLEDVLKDSKQTEAEAIAAESDSQAAYETFMKDSNKSLTAYQKAITSMMASKAETEESLTMAESDLAATMKTLEDLNEVLLGLHKSCDFGLRNFDARQSARATEIDALKEAKAILSGMK